MSETLSTDRRIQRTKKAIREAFVANLEEKGFDALSVSDITAAANINRSTFYLHYQDKYDLLEQIVAEIIGDIEHIFRNVSSLRFTEFEKDERPLPEVVTLFQYLKDNAALMHAILGLKSDSAVQNQIRKAIASNLRARFLTGVSSVNFLVPGEYLFSYLLSAHLGVTQTWLENGCQEPPYEIAFILSRLSVKGPFHAVRFNHGP